MTTFFILGVFIALCVATYLIVGRTRLSKEEVAFGNRMASPIEIGTKVRTGSSVGKIVDIAGRDAMVQITNRAGAPLTVCRRLERLQVVE